jgi:hypothetical protein
MCKVRKGPSEDPHEKETPAPLVRIAPMRLLWFWHVGARP